MMWIVHWRLTPLDLLRMVKTRDEPFSFATFNSCPCLYYCCILAVVTDSLGSQILCFRLCDPKGWHGKQLNIRTLESLESGYHWCTKGDAHRLQQLMVARWSWRLHATRHVLQLGAGLAASARQWEPKLGSERAWQMICWSNSVDTLGPARSIFQIIRQPIPIFCWDELPNWPMANCRPPKLDGHPHFHWYISMPYAIVYLGSFNSGLCNPQRLGWQLLPRWGCHGGWGPQLATFGWRNRDWTYWTSNIGDLDTTSVERFRYDLDMMGIQLM